MKGFLLNVCLIHFLVFSAVSGSAIAAENPVGKVIGISGKIQYLPESAEPVAEAKPGDVQPVSFDKWQKVEFHQPVFAKDKFRTSRKSRLKVLLLDNSLIALGPNSEMKVESYLYNKKNKLRQGVIGVAHGLSMYIVNKSQKNKKSSFRIVTPTANIAARGTQGFTSSSDVNTFTANKIGNVVTSNILASIPGVVELGPLMGNNVPKDGPPTEPVPLNTNTMNQLGNLVMGFMDPTSGGGQSGENSLIEIQGAVEEGGEEQDSGSAPEQTTDFAEQFTEASEGGLAEFFAPVDNPFPVTDLDTCTF